MLPGATAVPHKGFAGVAPYGIGSTRHGGIGVEVRVSAREDPWLKGWTRLTDNRHSASGWQPRPQSAVVRGGTGQNYVLVRWRISPQYRNGALVMPSWTALKGKLFHVASGGGRRMDDPVSTTDTTATGMGSSTTGYDVLPTGTQQMWQNEYFYVDGSVTLTVNERGADYGLNVFPTTWDAVEQDITTGPTQGATRYGLTRDTGKDNTPIPQYVTRTTPADPATVPQRSQLWLSRV